MPTIADGYVHAGELAVTMCGFGNPSTDYYIPEGSPVGVTKIHPGEKPQRMVDIVYIHEDEKTQGRATVPEWQLRACVMEVL